MSVRLTPPDRQAPAVPPASAWHAVARVYRVVGTRGRARSVIVVAVCPYCRLPHVHTGKPDFTEGQRTASCRGGRYLVHIGVLEGEATD